MENRVFVRIDEYKDVLSVMESVKGKLQKARDTLVKIQEIKKQEDAELDLWISSLDEVEHKIADIDDKILNPSM